jgi:hypothetical protein
MEQAAQIFAAVNLFVIGLSHVLHPRPWVEFFIWLRAKGHAGVFVNGMLSLSFGSVIVAFHNIWSGLPIVLTLVGWGQVLKGLLSLVAPNLAMRSLARVSPERAGEFRAPGVIFLVLSALFCYLAVRPR